MGSEDIITQLGKLLKRLPGVGERTAQRLIVHLLNAPGKYTSELSSLISELKDKVGHCKRCGNFTEREICRICEDETRSSDTICVVEKPSDIWAIEKSQKYEGTYHVLMGALSPIDGVGPEDLNLESLKERVKTEDTGEVIVATNTGMEGETTASYIAEILEPFDVRVTRIALGVPAGGDIEYADEITLGRALEGRKEL